MNGHGGKREGSGRKPKADEEKVRGLAIAAIEKKHGGIEQGFMALLETGEASLIKFVWEHAVGKPREKMDMDVEGGASGPAVIIQAPGGIDINLPSNTEEVDNIEPEADAGTTIPE